MRMSNSARLDSATALSISSLERPRKSAALVGLAASGATAEARRGAEERAAALDQASARYEALKAALLDKVDPGRGRPQPEERARRSRFRTWLLRLVNRIEAVPAGYGVPTGACATAPRDVVASQMWKA